jgi:hypothetical protein
MPSRITQSELGAATGPSGLTAARITQSERSIVALHTPGVLSIYCDGVWSSQNVYQPTVSVIPPPPPPASGGGPVISEPGKDKQRDKQKGKQKDKNSPPSAAPPVSSPSSPPAVSGPGGGEGIGGSGIGVGSGIGTGTGQITSPAETPVALMPVDSSFVPNPPSESPPAPPYQIVPRSALPPEYNRVPMPPGRPANQYDAALDEDGKRWLSYLNGAGRSTLGLSRGLSGLGGLGVASQAGWNQIRSMDTYRRGSRGLEREFFERGSVITPGPGVDVAVVDWTVPTGYEARIYAYYCIYTGTGFVQGSGDIVWGLRAGLNWVRNMGGLLYSVGSLASPFPVQDYVAAKANQRIIFQVSVPNLSGTIQVGTSRILCGVQGWLFPVTRRVEEEADNGR